MKAMKVGGRILAWCCIVASCVIFAPAERANAITIGYNVAGALDLDCTLNAVSVTDGCAFNAMFELIDPVMDGSTGNVPVNIMFELLDASNNVLSSYNGPFNAATVIVLASGDVIESDITDGAITGYSLSANFWSWDLDGYLVPVDFGNLNGVSVSTKPSLPPVPLPATVWLLLSAIGSLVLLSRRHRKVCAVPA